MAKHIIYCADGTWNNPKQDENEDQSVDPTNVYKLFMCVEGDITAESLLNANEQEKALTENGNTLQVAKYIHGVGDTRNKLVRLLAGAFGAGVISRVVRGYTFISRNYEPGANIHIVGFSRGAYTARALAGLIASQGLLAKALTADKEQAYRMGAQAWYRYRKTSLSKPSALAHLAEVVADLPAFLSQNSLADKDLVPVDRIATVAVWDTVGAMGFPEFAADGRRTDAFRFADTKLSPKVGTGLHALALDEQRHDFVPTLWEPADNATQVLFPGAHSDVGGGYPMSDGESGLSDNALQWMMEGLRKAGLRFGAKPPFPINPDAAGISHKPWTHFPFNVPSMLITTRSFPAGMLRDPSIAKRMAASAVICEPGGNPVRYAPENLP
ncbi:MAG TPA: DUF2235 domain-containing protein [Burkholderiales bacterium]|nr:DUF2235 domain-containing protein [Burkholderiales bacterium]